MDEKDAKIIEILRDNARTKNTDIARQIGLTEGAVRARITNLSKSGTIKKFTVETESVGVEGIILTESEAGKSKDVVARLKELSDRVFEMSGEFDAAVLVKAADVDHLNSIVDRIREIDGIVATSTLIRLA
jgi:Lrp/AsnC family transcriptional regulator, involved in the regulation of lysine biosynthesis